MNQAVSFDPRNIIAITDKYADIQEKSELVICTILQLIKDGKSLSVAWSGGKDSQALLVLAIEALHRAIDLGIYVRGFHVTHSDTELEIAMGFYTTSMIDSIKDYSLLHGLGIQVHIAYPELTQSFMYATIGRGRLPVFPGSSRKCTVDWKVKPQQKVLKNILKSTGGTNNHVTLIGTRLSESTSRKGRMEKRGETSQAVIMDDNGFYSLAPIADWQMMDVWELLMSIDTNRGTPFITTFVKDFEWTLELYKDANEGTCAIITGDNGNKSPCGSRSGCSMCLAISKDKSLESMINNEPEKYGHLKNVNAVRNYLANTQHDNSKRTIFGQTISKAGYINCRPDNYNGSMRQSLLAYFITLDQDERERAETHAEKWYAGELENTPSNERLCDIQFEFVSFEKLMAIDFIWSVQVVSERAFPALQIWHDVVELGRKKYPPVLGEDQIKHDKIPAKRHLFVGDDASLDGNDGLRNIYLEATNERRGLSAYSSYIDKASGEERRVAPHQTERKMTIDKQEACAFVTCEFPEIVFDVMHDNSRDGAAFLLHTGIVKLGSGKVRTYDLMAKRYQHLQRLLLTFNTFDNEGELCKETISDEEHELILSELSNHNGDDNLKPLPVAKVDVFENQLALAI